MSDRDFPKKYWWLVLVVVPISVAIISRMDFGDKSSGPSEGNTGSHVNVSGPGNNVNEDKSTTTVRNDNSTTNVHNDNSTTNVHNDNSITSAKHNHPANTVIKRHRSTNDPTVHGEINQSGGTNTRVPPFTEPKSDSNSIPAPANFRILDGSSQN